jgi:hypothetical protein
MNWHELQRRLPLPLAGCVLGFGGYFAATHPANANALLTHGYLAIWSGTSQSAFPPILEALRRDPGSPERWADAAEAMRAAGRDSDARYCLQQETIRAPHLPHAAMRAASLYFRLGDTSRALALTHRVVDETREYDSNVFQSWQRLGGTAAEVFAKGVETNVAAGQGYFRFLLEAADSEATNAAWVELNKRNMAGTEESRLYAEALVRSHDYAAAAAIEPAILPQGLWNSGFETDWTGRGLDWNVDSLTGIQASRDTAIRHSGESSLRLDFDDRNRGEYAHASEVRALAGGHWILRGFIRTDLHGAVAQSSGIGLRAVDLVTGRVVAETPRVNGSHDWTAIEARIDAGSTPRALRIQVLRPATPPSELTMRGSAWIDDVTLLPEGAR